MDLYARLSERFPISFSRDFSFAEHTTIGCGGTADVCALPATFGEAASLIGYMERGGIPFCFLGAGANVLPADGRFEGVVVRFSRLNGISKVPSGICAGAGVSGGALLRFAEEHGLGGLEFLTGIPMSLGGGVVMNAGVRGRHLSDAVEEVVAVVGGKLRVFPARDCEFSEKSSVFQSGIAVVGVRLRTESRPQEVIRALREEYAARRRLPKGRSMGCVFVNPPQCSAGALIEDCGLKGYAIGGARVSELHANFILNEGATSAQISALVSFVRDTVYRKTGILLREEIRRLPV